MPRGCCCARRASRSSPSPRWRSASARTPPSSASSTRCCFGRCRTRRRPARGRVGAQHPARPEEQRRLARQLHPLARAEPVLQGPLGGGDDVPDDADRRWRPDGAADPVRVRHVLPRRSASGRRSGATSRRRTRRGARSVVISDRLWRQRFGADPAIVKQSDHAERRGHAVIGVMPPGFSILDKSVDVWLPVGFRAEARTPRGRWICVVGRVKDGVSMAQAQNDMARVHAELTRRFPDFNTGWTARRRPAARAADRRRPAGALGDARRRRVRAAHRVRERRQPGARAGDGARSASWRSARRSAPAAAG